MVKYWTNESEINLDTILTKTQLDKSNLIFDDFLIFGEFS